MNDGDIFAFTPARPAQPPRARPARPLWQWLLLGTAVLLAVLVVAGAAALNELVQGSREGLNITINGDPWAGLHADRDLGFFGVLGIVAAVLSLLVVLPVVLMLVLLAVALSVSLALLAVVGAVALAAGIVLLAVALVLSPLWGSLLLLWLLLRPGRKPAPAPAAP